MVTPTSDSKEMERLTESDKADFRKRNQSILSRLEAPAAEGWRPMPGDTVIGEIIDTDTGGSEFGDYPILTVRRDDGTTVALHCFHSVLKSAVEKKRPRIGDRIGVVYNGRTDKGGFGDKGYESYRLVIERPTTATDDVPF